MPGTTTLKLGCLTSELPYNAEAAGILVSLDNLASQDSAPADSNGARQYATMSWSPFQVCSGPKSITDMSDPIPKRILHVPRRFVSEEWGGTETVVLELSRQQQRMGWQPEVVTTLALSNRRTEMIEHLAVNRFPYFYPFLGLSAANKAALDKKGGNLVSLSLFWHLLRTRDVRLFHCHAIMRLGGEVRTAARRRHKPYVVTLHGGVFDVPPEEEQSLMQPVQQAWDWGKGLGALFGSRRVLLDADMVICLGHGEYAKARTMIPHDRVAHLPNGVNRARFAKGDGERFRREHGIPPQSFLVMNISRIDAQKNQLMLLKAFARLRTRRPESQLVLMGPETQPNYAREMREWIQKSGLGSCALVLPPAGHGDQCLVDAYHACDVFVLPSLHEPFGIVVLEAWSCEKPVVASRVGGLQQVVRDGENGLLFDPVRPDAADELAAHLEGLAARPEWRQRLAESGRRDVESRYDWAKVSLQLEELYQAAEQHARQRVNERSRSGPSLKP